MTTSFPLAAGTARDVRCLIAWSQSGARGGRASTASRLLLPRPYSQSLGGRLLAGEANNLPGLSFPLIGKSSQDPINGFSKWQPSHLHCLRDLNRGPRINAQKSPDNRSNQSTSGVA